LNVRTKSVRMRHNFKTAVT